MININLLQYCTVLMAKISINMLRNIKSETTHHEPYKCYT